MKFTPKSIAAIIAATAALLLMLINSEKVKVDLLIAELYLPLWSLILISLGFGVLIGFALNGKSKKTKI
jgi:uncharacterized integral membrane protein